MELEFVYSQPVKIFFGAGNLQRLPAVLDEFGLKRCVLVCGKHFSLTAEELRRKDHHICAIFSSVEENPQLRNVESISRLARKENADAVIGIGGGSAIDAAKFAAAVAKGDGEPIDYFRGKAFPADRLAVIAIPTTAGTGSEVTQVSVVSHEGEKKTINDLAFMPKAAIVDPQLTMSVPPRVTMSAGLDALSHALEGYWSRNHQPISDLTAIEAVRLVLANLETAYRNGGDQEARGGMAYAALLGGLSFALPKTAACHACSYPLSELFGLPHGEACAFTLPALIRINADERLEYLCRAVGLRDAEELARRVEALRGLGGLRTKLSELGDVDAAALARACAAHPLMDNNPVALDAARLTAMFERM